MPVDLVLVQQVQVRDQRRRRCTATPSMPTTHRAEMPDSASIPKMMNAKTMIEPTSGCSRISSTGIAEKPRHSNTSCVVGSAMPFAFLRQQHRDAEHDRDLRELRRLDLEPAAEPDPGVRAVDGLPERRQHDQQAEHRRAVEHRGVGAQRPVVDRRRDDGEIRPDDDVEQRPSSGTTSRAPAAWSPPTPARSP